MQKHCSEMGNVTCCNAAVQGDMGWKTADHRHKLCVLTLWLRLMNMDREMIASKVFWHSYTLA